MKNKKCQKVKAPKIRAKKVSQKKSWPWLFVVAAILVAVAAAAFTAVEFYTAPRCGNHCAAYINYLTVHYMKLIELAAIVAGALIVIALLGAIFTPRQRKVKVKVTPVNYTPVVTKPQPLAKGVFKKKSWPWIFVIAAILTAVVALGAKVVEFFTACRCGNHCANPVNYITVHYMGLVNLVLIIAGVLVLVAILCAILFVRKRTLVLTANELTYKKGRKVVNIPVDSIQKIDFCAKGITVDVPHVKFKFVQLKNKKEVYDALLSQINALSTITTTVIAPTQSLTALAAPLLANPTLQGKLAYFGKLRESGLITKQQYDKYVDQSYKADC